LFYKQCHTNWTHFTTGFLLGLDITFIFAAKYKARADSNNT
jgi:hypothetical protein